MAIVLELLRFTCSCGWSGRTYARPGTEFITCPQCKEQTESVEPEQIQKVKR